VAGLRSISRSVTAEFGTATVVPATMIKPVAAITDFRNLPRIYYRPFPKPSYRILGICADPQLLSPPFLISIARRSYVKLHAVTLLQWRRRCSLTRYGAAITVLSFFDC
jgi:hypothetical protein